MQQPDPAINSGCYLLTYHPADRTVITGRISPVAACCSAPSLISFACASMVFFSFARDSPVGDPRRFTFAFFEPFLFIRTLSSQPAINVKIRNSKLEIRNKLTIPMNSNPNIETQNNLKSQIEIPNTVPIDLVWIFCVFCHLNLFRISDFDVRISFSVFLPSRWCPLRLCASQSITG